MFFPLISVAKRKIQYVPPGSAVPSLVRKTNAAISVAFFEKPKLNNNPDDGESEVSKFATESLQEMR
jgi:hypothetical protein